MSDDKPQKLTPDEVEETNRLADEFLAKIAEVPAAERIEVTSEKFDGPIGLPDDEQD